MYYLPKESEGIHLKYLHKLRLKNALLRNILHEEFGTIFTVFRSIEILEEKK